MTSARQSLHATALARLSTDRAMLGSATVRMPGTCGELVQGQMDGISFLVSCPIDAYSQVTVELLDLPGHREVSPGLPKSAAALDAALAYFGAGAVGARVVVQSSLPHGKGVGSSTADIAGVVYATALALGRSIRPDDVARMALNIEPTDGSLFPGIRLFDHRRGSLNEDLGQPVPLTVVCLVFAGEVDTVAFNEVDRSVLLRRLEPAQRKALELIRDGMACSRADLIGRGATMSALANQEILFKPELEATIDLSRRTGGLGVCVAHSGTVVGLLYEVGCAIDRSSIAGAVSSFYKS